MLVYVCSSLKPHTVKRVDALLEKLKLVYPSVEFFRPSGDDPDKLMDTVREDVKAIHECDELWVIGRYGRDCSWEIGYAMGLRKHVVIWEDHTNHRKIWSDWMWRIGQDHGTVQVRKLKEFV